MASESILKQLFDVAKASLYFKGLSDDDIWKACQNYQGRPDEDIEVAMENIKQEDQKILTESERKKNVMEENMAKMGALRQEESMHRQTDQQNADAALESFFDV